MIHLSLLLHNGAKFALLHAGTALDAFAAIDDIRTLDDTGNGAYGANPGAKAAALAFLCHDRIIEQRFAMPSRAALFFNMRLILIPEIFNCRKNRVGGRLSKAAKSTIFDSICQLFQLFDIPFLALAFCNALQDLQHTLSANAARRTLSAGFIRGKFQEEARYIHHAVILIHDNKPARTHH